MSDKPGDVAIVGNPVIDNLTSRLYDYQKRIIIDSLTLAMHEGHILEFIPISGKYAMPNWNNPLENGKNRHERRKLHGKKRRQSKPIVKRKRT